MKLLLTGTLFFASLSVFANTLEGDWRLTSGSSRCSDKITIAFSKEKKALKATVTTLGGRSETFIHGNGSSKTMDSDNFELLNSRKVKVTKKIIEENRFVIGTMFLYTTSYKEGYKLNRDGKSLTRTIFSNARQRKNSNQYFCAYHR